MKKIILILSCFLLLTGICVAQETEPSLLTAPELRQIQLQAEQGEAKAQNELGLLYEIGVDGLLLKDYVKAAAWHRKAAAQNYANAQYDLGRMYLYGYGVDADYAMALNWFKQAAEQGYVFAQSNVGIMYYFGYGVPKNDFEACKWFLIAENSGQETLIDGHLQNLAQSLPAQEYAEAQAQAVAWLQAHAAK